jgi:hypothetical protein
MRFKMSRSRLTGYGNITENSENVELEKKIFANTNLCFDKNVKIQNINASMDIKSNLYERRSPHNKDIYGPFSPKRSKNNSNLVSQS